MLICWRCWRGEPEGAGEYTGVCGKRESLLVVLALLFEYFKLLVRGGDLDSGEPVMIVASRGGGGGLVLGEV